MKASFFEQCGCLCNTEASWLFFLLFFQIFGNGCKALSRPQNSVESYFSLEYLAPLPFTIFESSQVLLHLHSDTLYAYNASKLVEAQSGILLYNVSLKKEKLDSSAFMLPDSISISDRFPLIDFGINANYAVFLLDKKLLLYKRHMGGVVWSVINLRHRYNELKLQGNHCVLIEAEFTDPTSDPLPARFCTLNMDTRDLSEERSFQVPEGIYFTISKPCNLAGFIGNQLAVASAPRYHITIYDSNITPITKLDRTPSDWKQLNSSNWDPRFASIQHLSARAVYHWLDPLWDKYSLMKRVDFLDDSTLLVSWFKVGYYGGGPLQKARETSYDLWRQRSQKWIILDSDLSEGDSTFYRKTPLGIMLPPPWSYACDESCILGVTNLMFDKNSTLHFEGVLKETNEYLKNHDPVYSVYVLKFNGGQK